MALPRVIVPGCALLAVLVFVTLTRADPDLWGHVRFGSDILDSGTIHVPETYSFTSDRPWVNHEWLSEVIMALAYRTGGAAGLVLLKLTIISLALVCIWRVARDDGASTRTAIVLTALALCGVLTRAQQVRPQLFSVLCFSLLILLLRRAEKRPGLLWLAPLLLTFWANTHGGWLVGFGTLGVWCAARTWTTRGLNAGARTRLLTMWSVCVVSLGATLINPYGIGLWTFLSQTVGPSRRFIAEWGPVTGELTPFAVWVIFALLTAVAVKRADRRVRLHAIAIPILWGVAAFKVSRLDAFFALSAIGFLTPELVRAIEDRRRRAEAAPVRPVSFAARVAMGALALLTIAVTVPLVKSNLLCIDVHAASAFPEPDAMTFIRNRQLRGKMVTFFDWGQYAIWYKPDGLLVSMDGRRETVYSDRNVDLHLDMYLGIDDGLAYLESLHADYVWMPNELPLSSTLLKSPAWTPVYRGVRSIIFARSTLAPPAALAHDTSDVACRCFPGP